MASLVYQPQKQRIVVINDLEMPEMRFLTSLPRQIYVLNNLCHQFVYPLWMIDSQHGATSASDCQKCLRCENCHRVTSIPNICLLCGRIVIVDSVHKDQYCGDGVNDLSKCVTEESYIVKACPCDVILNCQAGEVFFIHNKRVLRFGSMQEQRFLMIFQLFIKMESGQKRIPN